MTPIAATSAAVAAGDQGGIAGWATQIMETMGAPGVGLLIGLENLFPPIPSELVLPMAGFAAGRGAFGFPAAVVWATVGSVGGALALYWLGAVLGRDRLIHVIDRMPLVDVSVMVQAEDTFRRHGRGAVFFGRLVPGVRSLVSIPAGLARMDLAQFTLYTTLGSLLWNAALIGAGLYLGERWDAVAGYVEQWQYVIIAVVTVLFVVAVIRRVRRKRGPGEDTDARDASAASPRDFADAQER